MKVNQIIKNVIVCAIFDNVKYEDKEPQNYVLISYMEEQEYKGVKSMKHNLEKIRMSNNAIKEFKRGQKIEDFPVIVSDYTYKGVKGLTMSLAE